MATYLIIIGAAFEVAGFGLVALDLRDVERDSQVFSRKHIRVLGRTATAETTAPPPKLLGAEELVADFAERVNRLEFELNKLGESLADFHTLDASLALTALVAEKEPA